VDPKHRSDTSKDRYGRVLLTTLDTADIPRVDLGSMSQRFLGQAVSPPQTPYVQPNDFLPTHSRISGIQQSVVEEL
jgi:hypothetical protein